MAYWKTAKQDILTSALIFACNPAGDLLRRITANTIKIVGFPADLSVNISCFLAIFLKE